MPNHYFDLYSPIEKILRIVFVTFFMEIGVNVKKFLRLSHLEQIIIFKIMYCFGFYVAENPSVKTSKKILFTYIYDRQSFDIVIQLDL